MQDIVSNCPVCNNTTFGKLHNCIDYTVSKEEFGVVSCGQCGFTITNPRPAESEAGKYYRSDEYISHSDSKKGMINTLYHAVRKRTLKQKLQMVNSLNHGKGKLLDIGCGTGYFLETCKDAGWEVNGIEPGMDYIDFPLSIKDDIKGKNLLDIDFNTTFNIISMWHVLEHVYSLNESLIRIKSLLNDNGKLIIAVPNSNSHDCRHYGKYWAGWDVPRHIWHFTPESMKNLLEKNGLNLQQTLPMKFDSFYVSMLSERYKHGGNRLLSAFTTGLKSNMKATSDGNYSSLIYIAGK